MAKIKRNKLLACLRCGHKWIPFIASPQRCPKCFSYSWSTPWSTDAATNDKLIQGEAIRVNSLISKSKEWRSEYMRDFYKHHIGTGKKGVRYIDAPDKRLKPVLCELCSRCLKLGYHHWNDKIPSMGLWLCPSCHHFAEKFDKGYANKYIRIKADMELKFNRR